MMFETWALENSPVNVHVPASPAGPLNISSWATEYGGMVIRAVPPGGCAIVLPTQPTTITWGELSLSLLAGCYAQVPGGAWLRGGAGLIIHTPEYVGLVQAGGPVEALGRLKYIDGCSDSLLVCPARLGDPCLNLLHLPPKTAQTAHTHPSDRVGIILRGRGVCRTAVGDTVLGPGAGWYIPPEYIHSFHTEDESLDVLAWHPDSDFGPSHDWHPMINRTIVEGTAANDARHAGIRTT